MPDRARVLSGLHELTRNLSFDGDVQALSVFRERVADAARRQAVLTYSELASGVSLQLPNVNGGAPFELGVPEWLDLHRAIIGEYLFRLAAESFEQAEFFSSAIVIGKAEGEPSDGFRELLVKTGYIGSKKDDAWMRVWVEHMERTYSFYGGLHRDG